MDQRSLRRLSKTELLTMLRDQEIEISELKKKNALLKKKLANKKIAIEESGSIAQASLALTKIFEEAQKAVDYYYSNRLPDDVDRDELLANALLEGGLESEADGDISNEGKE